MDGQISQSEKLDIFLALATFYKFEAEEIENNSANSQIDVALQTLSALEESELLLLKERAKRFDSMKLEKQKVWQTFWLEKLRTRGQPARLDENIHYQHIISALEGEPKKIQTMIFEKLPPTYAQQLKQVFPDLAGNIEMTEGLSANKKLPAVEIAAIVRTKFLSDFVAFEDIYKPNAIDKLTTGEVTQFILKLGIRETAISCRGIKTKENLAIFLKPFGEQITKEIAHKITELENISPERVRQSEKIINDTFKDFAHPEEKLKNLGLRLLATTQIMRDNNSKRYTIQKLSVEAGRKLKILTEQLESHTISTPREKSSQFINLGQEIIELAADFKINYQEI